VVGQLRDSAGWQSEEAEANLQAWQANARRRLERVEDGEALADVSSICRLCASCRTVTMIFSILTAISQPMRFCSSVTRLRQAGGE
jgi:hypothetical protein